jgi:hypothetical protein
MTEQKLCDGCGFMVPNRDRVVAKADEWWSVWRPNGQTDWDFCSWRCLQGFIAQTSEPVEPQDGGC